MHSPDVSQTTPQHDDPACDSGSREGARARPHVDDARTGLSAEAFRRGIADHLVFTLGADPATATLRDRYMACALAVRDRLAERHVATVREAQETGVRRVVYLSAEYLPGPHLGANLLALDAREIVEGVLAEQGASLDELIAFEPEPGLGNGGLGRLAACFMDSLATLRVPAVGHGIRYEFGIFTQVIRDGGQVELTDTWLRQGNPWEIARHEIAVDVGFGGHVEGGLDASGRYRARWLPEVIITGLPHDTLIPGFGTTACNALRLWKAEAKARFDFAAFNAGDFQAAVASMVIPETVTKVLYPCDEREEGKRLRLQQQYFFVACALQDLVREHLAAGHPLSSFHERHAIQLNDTHPAVAIPEFMRLLVDVHGMEWYEAWLVTHATFSYTNHTLMPEALESWDAGLFESLLPRHVQIIHEINRRVVDDVRAMRPGDEDLVARMSILDTRTNRLRMAHLATVGSHAVNGVSALHSELLRTTVLADFASIWGEKFTSVTNGVSPRRFLALSNPDLARLLTRHAGDDGWLTQLESLRALEPLADDAGFREDWSRIKAANKRRLAAQVAQATGEVVDPDSMFDIQVKRIHEYKRQHLNVLHALTLYRRLKDEPGLDVPPRTILFGGKAAASYFMAKLMIRLIHATASLINRDPAMKGRLRVVFLPGLSVKSAEPIYAAADLSEQISVAGTEASGTGNMKLAMNGALTIGTYDGANIELRDAVGPENFFLFGLAVDGVRELHEARWRPRDMVERDDELRAAIDLVARGVHPGAGAGTFTPLVEHLLDHDTHFVLADYRAYVDCQATVSSAFRNTDEWTRRAILSALRCGPFSSDRAIAEYCARIWNTEPLPG